MKFNQFLEIASKIKNLPLPGEQSQFKMSPPYRETLIAQQKEKIPFAKKAAVLALFYPNINSATYFILILRKTYKGVHSAQVGFPGGKAEKQDNSLKDTALRETQEEIGVPKNEIKVIKKLTQLYIPPSNFYVQPYIATCSKTPKFIKQEEEVEAILQIPLAQLLLAASSSSKKIVLQNNTTVSVPAFSLENHKVWGATAMMLNEIKDLINETLKTIKI